MPIVKVSAKSRYGFVVNEVRGFVVTAKGVDVDTESKLYTVIQPYITKGILVQEGDVGVAKPIGVSAKPVNVTAPETAKAAVPATENPAGVVTAEAVPAELPQASAPTSKKKKGNKNTAEATEADIAQETTETTAPAQTPAPEVIEPSMLSFS